ncbi:MAG: 50S ribosomal protein L11 methyltransferase [Kiritimatiellae bacterium]|nr:50S ribosomal protein L11 methyltransferase [Kiritimatiellia bacterium]
MTKVYCSVPERCVNPLFEVFDGGDFVLTSYRDVESPLAEMRIYFEEGDPRPALARALEIVGCEAEIKSEEVAEEDWRFSYRRHFKTELVSPHILVQPEWERLAVIKFDPGLAFGTGRHETTKACLQYIDELAPATNHEPRPSFLDMGCGSGILSIAAAKLGYAPVRGFDVDPDAVAASRENAAKNGVEAEFFRHALGGRGQGPLESADLVVANILGPLLIRFADEIVPCVKRHLVVSGILNELYPEVLAAYEARSFREVSRKTIGEWTTGLLEVVV